LQADAAGVDVGATEIYIAVPEDRDAEPVRRFATFTEDLSRGRLASWLRNQDGGDGVNRGVLDPVLSDAGVAGLQVWLVNARHVKNVPGRKTM